MDLAPIHDNVVYVDQLFLAITENLDEAVFKFSLVVQSVELFLFLPVIYGSDSDDDTSGKSPKNLPALNSAYRYLTAILSILSNSQAELSQVC